MTKLVTSNTLYLGIDQSLTNTALCVYHKGEVISHSIIPKMTGVKRLSYIYTEFTKLIDQYKPSFAAIEGYAYNAKGLYFNLGEVGGILRLALFMRNITLIQVPPTTLKKYITGKGNANKDIIIKDLYKNYGIDVNDNNVADATGLAILAREYFETEYHCIPALRTDLHKACELVIGDHPKPLSPAEYFASAKNKKMKVYEYEELRKKKK